ncbi:hypothetical protein GCM10027048_17160 [Hymenobacter coalescens]
MSTYEACVSPSDAAGNLLFYANSEKVWNRNHAIMPNGSGLNGHTSASQMAYAPRPGTTGQYYLFTVDAMESQLQNGLRYSLVDMSLQGGLGDVVPGVKGLRLLTPSQTGLVGEQVTVVPHANRTDYWLVVHGWDTNEFYSFRVSANGITPLPVISIVGPLQSATSPSGFSYAAGALRASPDGRQIAMSSGARADFDLYDFDPATGRLSNYLRLPDISALRFCYGVEFSPDGSRLYATSTNGGQTALLQYNLRAGSPMAIAASAQLIGTAPRMSAAGLLAGPNGKIYMAGVSVLHIIDFPNQLGMACGFRLNGLSLGSASTTYALPNTIQLDFQPVLSLSFTAAAACLPAPTAFTAVAPGFTNGVFTWNFGDPASGAANTAAGLSATHAFSAPGTYTVTLQGASNTGTASATQTVTVVAPPNFSLGRDTVLCPGSFVVLQPTAAQPAGSTYRWQDGSTGATLAISAPGAYSLEITRNGCSSRDEVVVRPGVAPVFSLGADTAVCFEQPLVLRPVATPPAGTRYNWQDGSAAATLRVTAPGTYALTITRDGCSSRDEIVVGSKCAVVIPNIITPDDGDRLNQTFVLQGLISSQWALTVFNRWGKQVYQVDRYDNNWGAAGQPAGVYYYLLRNAATGEQYKGWVEVMRR